MENPERTAPLATMLVPRQQVLPYNARTRLSPDVPSLPKPSGAVRAITSNDSGG